MREVKEEVVKDKPVYQIVLNVSKRIDSMIVPKDPHPYWTYFGQGYTPSADLVGQFLGFFHPDVY